MDLAAIEAVLFDMDGTLVDSDAAVVRSWQAWAREYGVDVELILADLHGHPSDSTVRRVRPDLDEDARRVAAARQLELQYDDLHDVVAMPGAGELLAWLDAVALPWAIVTSADRALAAARLGAAGIDAPVLVTVEEVARGKPAPDGYLEAARRLGATIERCLVVEDAGPGIASARAAGAPVAALRGLAGDLEVTALHEVREALARSRLAS